MTAQTGLPVIDISALTTGDVFERRAVGDAVVAACREHGFFYATGHGLRDDRRDAVFDDVTRFFALPSEIKNAVSVDKSEHFRGYEPPTDADSKEGFVMGREMPADDPRVVDGTPYHAPNAWPDGLDADWRQRMQALFGEMLDLARLLNRGLALGLKLDEGYFDTLSDDPMAALRLLHYPPHCERPGIHEHTDWGALSVLFQNDVPGLQVRGRDGAWIDVPPMDGACVVNVGDLVARWTNDMLKSTPHRVVNRTGRDRYSVCFFLDMNYDAMIECLPGCADEHNPAKYAPVRVADYLDEMHRRDYGT